MNPWRERKPVGTADNDPQALVRPVAHGGAAEPGICLHTRAIPTMARAYTTPLPELIIGSSGVLTETADVPGVRSSYCARRGRCFLKG